MRRAVLTDGRPCLVFTVKFLPTLRDAGWIVANHAFSSTYAAVADAQDDADALHLQRARGYLLAMTKREATEVIRDEHWMAGYEGGADFEPPQELVEEAIQRVEGWWPE